MIHTNLPPTHTNKIKWKNNETPIIWTKVLAAFQICRNPNNWHNYQKKIILWNKNYLKIKLHLFNKKVNLMCAENKISFTTNSKKIKYSSHIHLQVLVEYVQQSYFVLLQWKCIFNFPDPFFVLTPRTSVKKFQQYLLLTQNSSYNF